MRASLVIRRSFIWTIAVVAAAIVVGGALLAAVDAGVGHALLIRGVALRMGRQIKIDGPIHTHFFSLTPRLLAEHVAIGNPPWMPPGLTAEVGKLSMEFKLPGFSHPAGIVRLAMEDTTLYLQRDARGHANWQMLDPAKKHVHRNSPILRSLSVPNAHVILEDALHHLQFDGIVSAQGPDTPAAAQPVKLEGTGQLNGRPATFEISADPLVTASHRRPYHFTFAEQSGGSRIEAQGQLPEPFDFTISDARFTATGPDLKDLFFLVGAHLIDTGDYHLAGEISRRGPLTEFRKLAAASGRSDMHGSVSVDRSADRKRFNVELGSKLLVLSDLGPRAAGRLTTPKPPLVMSDAMISLNVLRIADTTTRFQADELDIGRVPLRSVSARATITGGVLTVTQLVAQVLGGRANVHLSLDGRNDVPGAKVDLRIDGLQLAQLPYKDPNDPPLEGPLRVRVTVTGKGRSVHQIAATADGSISAQLAQGSVRESFAELTGLDLRGLRLLLTRDKRDIPVRCAAVNLKARGGTLTVQNLIADTDPMLISGRGQIYLDSEALDLSIRGNPKSLRLFRLRTPVQVQGTLMHPSIHIQDAKSSLVVVDRGRTPDADCASLLAAP